MQSGQMPAGTPNQAWASLDLLLLFSQLYDNGHAPAVHEILELPQAQCPDLLVLSTASALRCIQCLLWTMSGLPAHCQPAALTCHEQPPCTHTRPETPHMLPFCASTFMKHVNSDEGSMRCNSDKCCGSQGAIGRPCCLR